MMKSAKDYAREISVKNWPNSWTSDDVTAIEEALVSYAREVGEAVREAVVVEAERRMYDRISPPLGAEHEESIRWQERVLTAKEIAAACRQIVVRTP